MREYLRPTIDFIRQHFFPFLMFVLASGFIFFTTIILDQSVKSEISSSDQDLTLSQYVFYLDHSSSDDVHSLIKELERENQDFYRIFVFEDAEIVLRSGDIIDYPVIAVYPDLPDQNDFYVERGETSFSESDFEVMITSFGDIEIFSLIAQTMGDSNRNVWFSGIPPMEQIGEIYINKEGPYSLISVVIASKYLDSGLIIPYNNFLQISSRCDKFLVQFHEPLTREQEDVLLQTIAQYVSVSDIDMPYQYSDEDISHYREQTFFHLTIIVICLLSVMFIFQFLLKLRDNEFRIAKILGATQIYTLGQAIMLLLLSAIASMAWGANISIEKVDAVEHFVEFLLSYEIQSSGEHLSYDRLPLSRVAFDHHMYSTIAHMEESAHQDVQAYITVNGEDQYVDLSSRIIRPYHRDRNWEESFLSMISRAQGLYIEDHELSRIVTEEIYPYLDGQKSLDQAVSALHSRVRIYLAEK